MDFKIIVEEKYSEMQVLGFANSSSSYFEAIQLGVGKDYIRCGTSTAIPTRYAEEYIDLYYQVLSKAREVQKELQKNP